MFLWSFRVIQTALWNFAEQKQDELGNILCLFQVITNFSLLTLCCCFCPSTIFYKLICIFALLIHPSFKSSILNPIYTYFQIRSLLKISLTSAELEWITSVWAQSLSDKYPIQICKHAYCLSLTAFYFRIV